MLGAISKRYILSSCCPSFSPVCAANYLLDFNLARCVWLRELDTDDGADDNDNDDDGVLRVGKGWETKRSLKPTIY